MKKHLTAGRVIRYLLYLSTVSTLVISVTYARFTLEMRGEGSISAAAVAMDITGGAGNSALDLTTQLQGLHPGEKKELTIAVTNQKGDIASEVAQEYSITISTTGNLPLTYTLTSSNSDDSSEGTYVTKLTEEMSGTVMTWTGGLLPYVDTGTGIAHTYKLTVEWPSGSADEKLADEIDLVTLTVDAKQVQPKEN